jgi:hypothetical protein
MYAFSHEAADVAIDGQTFRDWFINEYVLGVTADASLGIAGFFLDDGIDPVSGWTEGEQHAVQDMGLSRERGAAAAAALAATRAALYEALLARGLLSWQQLLEPARGSVRCAAGGELPGTGMSVASVTHFGSFLYVKICSLKYTHTQIPIIKIFSRTR